ncbi:MAG TPA: hypothetical protein VMU88_06565 [bacterium]|nr:hypothetical protein [bacterium]
MTRNPKALGAGLLLLALTGGISPVQADLQWITGSVPKNPVDAGNPGVKDAPSAPAPAAGAASSDLLICHMITCTKIVNDYPNDSVNYFYLNKNDQICFYLYFLIKPASRIHTVSIECTNPLGIQIAKYDQEFRVGFTDRLLTVDNETYQWFLSTLTLGMDHLRAEYGQTGLPKDPGLYTFKTSIDGQEVGVTFFYVKPQPIQPPSPIATVAPGGSMTGPAGLMPLSTPISSLPIQNKIP